MNDLSGIAPTEMRAGEDIVQRFTAEVLAVQGTLEVCDRAGLANAVAAAVLRCGALRVALTADLGAARTEIDDALRGREREVHLYETAAADRSTSRTLEATVTGCLAAVAATGSILTGGPSGRAGALIAPVHICVVERSRLVAGLTELLRSAAAMQVSALALQSGPSRTADIEKTLVLGMHGPKTVHVVLLEGTLD